MLSETNLSCHKQNLENFLKILNTKQTKLAKKLRIEFCAQTKTKNFQEVRILINNTTLNNKTKLKKLNLKTAQNLSKKLENILEFKVSKILPYIWLRFSYEADICKNLKILLNENEVDILTIIK